jgi:uncharacterized protein
MPASWVTDASGVLSPQTLSEQNARLRAYEQKTGHQILVYVAPSTGGVPIEDWAVRAFQKWQVGRKGLDDGLVLFIFTQDRTLRIEVGYGFEPVVPDVLASRIIRETIAPALAAGQPDRAVAAGLDRILALTGDAVPESQQAPSDNSGEVPAFTLGPLQLIFIGLFVFLLLSVILRSPWLALYFLVNMFGGRGGGGYSGGGGLGGFSGGGGRSGGGGASGSW